MNIFNIPHNDSLFCRLSASEPKIGPLPKNCIEMRSLPPGTALHSIAASQKRDETNNLNVLDKS